MSPELVAELLATVDEVAEEIDAVTGPTAQGLLRAAHPSCYRAFALSKDDSHANGEGTWPPPIRTGPCCRTSTA